jgi:hypothetical protein
VYLKRECESEVSRPYTIQGAKQKLAQSTTITVKLLTYNELMNCAIAHYNKLKDRTKASASRMSPLIFLHRIMVNYLRHECTEYTDRINALIKLVGSDDAVRIVRSKTYEAICAHYPQLTGECADQMRLRNMS